MTPYKQVAIDAVKEAGELLSQLSKNDIKYKMKTPHDILAEGDLISEEIIINKIKSHFTNHSILSEEKGEENLSPEFLWIIDPIDGTINFSRHIEEFCISIALQVKERVILGLIYQPLTDKMYVAERGKGAYLNKKRIFVSKEKDIIKSLIATDISSNLEARTKTFRILSNISSQVRHVRIFGSSALHLTRLAEGQIDLYFKTVFKYWDFAAGMIIAEEAGGIVTDFEGNPLNRNSKNILATNNILHPIALKIIKKEIPHIVLRSVNN